MRKLLIAKKYAEAEEILGQLIKDNPDDADAWFHLAQSQQFQDRLPDAAQIYRKLLGLRPDHADAHANLGILLCRLGQRDQGEICLREAIRLQPNLAKAHCNLGVLLAQSGKKAAAVACWQETIRVDPDYPEGHFNLAVHFAENNQPDDAVRHYERALQARPDYAAPYGNLGLLYLDLSKPAEAVVLLEHALRLNPHSVNNYNNLGLAYANLGRLEDAIGCYREALKRRPGYAEVYNNMGTALTALGRGDEAQACFAQALRLKPDYPEAHWHQSLNWLHEGDLARGWPEYEWRWKRRRSRPRRFKEPLWDGSNLEGKTILLWCEQGLGDSLQFIRYASLVKARGGNVVVECPPALMNLFFTCPGIDQLVPQESQLPHFDVQTPTLTLPGIFGTRLHSIPADVPYLLADDNKVSQWREEFAAAGKKFRIGIVWQGNPKHRWDHHRSFELEQFLPISRLPGVQFYSLQKDVPPDDLLHFTRRHGLIDLAGRLENFTDTAAVMKNLDLVISCDSSPAHLAGALGVPVWVPLSAMCDWRWLRDREDSPWYPTLRLFRQKRLGDWREVFDRMTAEVAGLLPK